ncbi:MAG: hypothetical protein HEP71_26440 [Roseivirga sp.]|nr:hypothetical protein [Roseivirga sp.]
MKKLLSTLLTTAFIFVLMCSSLVNQSEAMYFGKKKAKAVVTYDENGHPQIDCSTCDPAGICTVTDCDDPVIGGL